MLKEDVEPLSEKLCTMEKGLGTYLYLRRHLPGWRVEPASPIELTTSRAEALQARRSRVSSLETFTQSFLHRA